MFAEDLSNSNDVEYFANITLGGAPYSVQIDTGSSDLWVAADSVPNAKGTGKTAKVTYAVGEAEGPIMMAELEFAEYKVPQQAFFQVQPDSSHPANIGLIGLGPGDVSTIFTTLNSDSGAPPVDSIFNQNKSSPNFLSVLLGRSDDPDNPFPGDLTIGTYLDGYEAIQNQPQLTVDTAKHGNQHWSILLDPDGIIGPNGDSIPLQTTVSSTKNSQQLTAFFDTGFTLPQVPSSVAQTIYSQIEGATLVNNSLGEIWSMGCDKEVNITFKAGNQSYHINPLDATMSLSDLGVTGDGCVGTFQPIGANAVNADTDMILGMAFLRNVYLLVNYGDFIVGSTSKASPFVQLLSTSNDTATMHQEFVQVRLNGVDTTNTQTLLTPDTSGDLTPSSSSNGDTNMKKILIYAGIGAGGLAVLLLLGFCISSMCRRRSKGSGGILPSPWEGRAGRYQQLGAPAPSGAPDMTASYTQQYRPTEQYRPPNSYSTPWGPN
jgi:hypothetical protein